MRAFLAAAIATACTKPNTATAPVSQPADRVLSVGGATIAIHVRGVGPTCLVVPGGPGLDWTYLRMPAVERALTLVYIEPVGTGGSSRVPADQLTRARWAADLDGVRAALALDRPCIIGHSYGGFVAQTFAVAHPDRVGALVLYDTSPRTDAAFGEAIGAGLARFKTEPWFADAMAASELEASAKTDDEMTALFHREVPLLFAEWTKRRGELEPMIASVRAYAPRGSDHSAFDVRAELPKLHARALVIVGRGDAITSVPFANELHDALAGSELVVLEHSGHMGHLEEPDAFARAVIAFVTATPSP